MIMFKQIKDRTTKPQMLKRVQHDTRVGRALAFTLAEVLIVIGIIGVVAALTLPNLNHATGDKETVTRLQKAYSILNEANDRAVAIYGPISTWLSNEQCAENFTYCWMKRVGEFLKISKSCNETSGDEEDGTYTSCDSFAVGGIDHGDCIYQLTDGIVIEAFSSYNCNKIRDGGNITDICFDLEIDVNGPQKGKNTYGYDQFLFMISDKLGILPLKENEWNSTEDAVSGCMQDKDTYCTWWVLEYGNLDYLKADSTGKCNDSNIILDGTTNTSCH